MNRISAAVIGLGRIASLLEDDALREKPCTHTGAIAANPDCELVAGCDIDGTRRHFYSERWQVPVYNDAAEMICSHKPQIVVVATHPDSHYRYCRLAAQNSVPLVICEKPLADTFSHARKIARLADRGTIIITNHERRYSADYIRARGILESSLKNAAGDSVSPKDLSQRRRGAENIGDEGKGKKTINKKLIDTPELGKLLSVRAAICMGKTRRLLDVLWHDGTHLADAIMYLTGGTLKHKRRWGASLTKCAGTAWLQGELALPAPRSRIPVLMELGAGRDHLVFEIEFSCENGRLRIGNGVFEIWESAPSPYAEQFRSLKMTCETFEGPTGYFANMIKDAVACLREPGRQPCSSVADGLRVIQYLNSIKAWR